MNLCKYKNLFGPVNQGIHSYKLYGISVLDVLVTLIAAILISYLFKTSLLFTTIILFILGIILHRIFCVRTTVDKLLFPNL